MQLVLGKRFNLISHSLQHSFNIITHQYGNSIFSHELCPTVTIYWLDHKFGKSVPDDRINKTREDARVQADTRQYCDTSCRLKCTTAVRKCPFWPIATVCESSCLIYKALSHFGGHLVRSTRVEAAKRRRIGPRGTWTTVVQPVVISRCSTTHFICPIQ